MSRFIPRYPQKELFFFFRAKSQKTAAQPVQRETCQFIAANRFVPHWFKCRKELHKT